VIYTVWRLEKAVYTGIEAGIDIGLGNFGI